MTPEPDELETFKVFVQRYLEETAVITVTASDCQAAREEAERIARDDDSVEWGPGDDMTGPEAYQVNDDNGAEVWERGP